jgi:multimeric flavodoxin WrbA
MQLSPNISFHVPACGQHVKHVKSGVRHTERGYGGQHMKRVTAFVGTARKKSTYNAVHQFLENLRSLGDVEYEIVALNDHRLGTCRGCKLCFEKGEEFCPLTDDRDVFIEKMMASDGVVFASPNYSSSVTRQKLVHIEM